MREFFQFLQDYEIWIYSILGGIGLIFLRRVIISFQTWRGAVFGLEKESAQRRFSSNLTVMVFIGLLLISELMLVSFVSPAYAVLKPLATPTLNILATPTVELVVEVPQEAMTPTPLAVATLVLGQEGCVPGQVEWISPEAGEEVRGQIELIGTVDVPSLGFYKYEYSQPGSDFWMTIAGGNQPTTPENNLLGEWNTSQLVPGDYLLRLVVMNNQNVAFPVCIIPIRVLAPLP